MASTFSCSHPCFDADASGPVGRLQLPVAPRANCKIRFDAAAKPLPAMRPEDAAAWAGQVVESGANVGIVGVAGPGDPLAAPEPTLRALRLVRRAYPEMPLCLTTLGLGAAECAGELAEIGLSHVTLSVDAVDPEVAGRIYAWIRPGTKTVPLAAAAELLVEAQAAAVIAFKAAGLTVKINTTIYPGVNEDHVEAVAERVAGLGADLMAVVPFHPSGDFSAAPEVPDETLLSQARERASRHMPLLVEWAECGVEVGGTLPEGASAPAATMPKPSPERPNVAVASSSGMDIDLHLGHAVRLLIYGPREDGLSCLLETRDAPESGGGSSRWERLADVLSDCFVLLTASAGDSPKRILGDRGLTVLVTDGEIEGTVDVLYGGGKKGKKSR